MPRHFPPRWTVEQIPGGYKIKDTNPHALAYAFAREIRGLTPTPRKSEGRTTLDLCRARSGATSPLVKDNFLTLAQTWSRLARELEASKRFLEALGEEFPVKKPLPPRGRVA